MSDSYQLFRVRAPARDARQLLETMRETTVPRWRDDGAACWGMWQGLFGIASNEVLVMAAVQGDLEEAHRLAQALPAEATVVDTLALQSTVRPAATEPLSAQGLYVFRVFDVRLADCEEIVALSREAWETFENTDRYASRPLGLFRPRDAAGERGRMLLVTWYDGFASWETSRAPAPEARENFQRRHHLTAGTVAYAARLVPAWRGPAG